jgi:hypothetical protein
MPVGREKWAGRPIFLSRPPSHNAASMPGTTDATQLPIEQALLNACARQLTIEVQRLRLERRLREVAAGDGAERPDEMPRLTRLLARAERELSAQGRLITSLRLRQRSLQPG